MEHETMPLATELLKEIQISAKRWFIAFLIMLVVEVLTVAGFLWYLSLPVDEVVTVENDDGNANYVGGYVEGGIHNGENNGA